MRVENETTVYTTCVGGCGSTTQCVLKAHVRNGEVVAVEPDDRVHPNVGREDAAASDQDLSRCRLQRRPCAIGLVLHKQIAHPDRIVYPLKRVPGTRRGGGEYTRIGWDEALDIVAGKMTEMRQQHGPYSTINPFPTLLKSHGLGRLFSLWGAGVDGWGFSSFDSITLMSHLVTGAPGLDGGASSSAADMLLNAKLIVLWGHDPTMGNFGPGRQFAWYVKLARERGKRVIIIDPRYTVAAEVLADQWIPIRPGTDLAMFLAMANVLFKEDLWDKDFVHRHVEPSGFEKWRRYVLGSDDGVEKTPEWAELECAVPAETIRELTRLVAANKPSWLWCQWAVSRKSQGEQTARGFAALQALLGNWGIPGAGPPVNIGPAAVPIQVPWGPDGSYKIPTMYRGHYWAQAILLRDKVRTGELSKREYMRIVGWQADPALLKDFNPKMVFAAAPTADYLAPNFLVTVTDSPNDQIRALDRMDFMTIVHTTMTPTVRYADVILPTLDPMYEEAKVTSFGFGFSHIGFCPAVSRPPEEAKSSIWIYLKLAEKLGIDPRDYFSYYSSDQNWERDYDRYVRDTYAGVVEYYKKRNIQVPAWEEFTAGKFINCDASGDGPFVGWQEQTVEEKPFATTSGKIEIYSSYLADEANRGKGEHLDVLGRKQERLPSDWGELPPMPVYKKTVKGMDDPAAKDYPLMLLSPHPRYRVHSGFWNHPWLKDHVYRHRAWINTADAKTRVLKDDDLVTIHNDRGTVVVRAYVTNRVMPGIIVLHEGGWYAPDESSVDFGGSASTLLGGDFKSGTTPAKTTTLVQVEKYEGAR